MSKKINVALLLGSNNIGGMERQASLLAKGLLHDDKLAVTVFFCDIPLRKNFLFTQKIDFSPTPQYWLFYSKYTGKFSDIYFVKQLKKRKIDIVVAYNYESLNKVTRCLKYLKDVKIIGNIRGIKFAFDKYVADRYRESCQTLEQVICNSGNTKRLLVEKKICRSEIITTINNGIKIHPSVLKKNRGVFKILFAASLSPVKDPICFAKAICLVLEEYFDIEVLIAGDGICKNEMELVFSGKGLLHKIKFLGKVAPEDVPYNKVDLFVSTSLREASSNSILEALSNSVPVVATSVGGTVDILQGKPFAYLFPSQDERLLADAIIRFYKMPVEKYDFMGKEAIKFIKNEYSLEKMIEEYKKLFMEIYSR